MKPATFQGTCRCGKNIDVPMMGSMSYGAFVYFDTAGNGAKHYDGLNCPTWDFVAEIVAQGNVKNEPNRGNFIQEIIGKVADAPEFGATYTQTCICPKCRLRVRNVDRDARTGFVELATLTFKEFERKQYTDKVIAVSQLIDEIETRNASITKRAFNWIMGRNH